MSNFLKYISDSDYNFHISLLRLHDFVYFFSELDVQIEKIFLQIHAATKDGSDEVSTYFAISLRISQRILRNAFNLFLRRMPMDGLLLFRVCLENAVFSYRIFKQPELYKVWAEKDMNKQSEKEFARKFRRDDIPSDMPDQTWIRMALKSLSEYFAHPNVFYFSPHVVQDESAGDAKLQFSDFDFTDERFRELLILFSDGCLTVYRLYRKILEKRLEAYITSSEPAYQQLRQLHRQLRIEKRWISLGMRQTEPNPWLSVEERYPVGTRVEGTIRNLTDFGAFVELEEGIDGLIHVSDMSWTKRVSHPSEVLKRGDKVEAIVLHVDKTNRRISLGLKQSQPDPWQSIVPDKYRVGMDVKAKVVRLTDFGAFVELEDGVEGLLHISELSHERVAKPEDVVPVGSELTLKIIKLDADERKLGLSLRAYLDGQGEEGSNADSASQHWRQQDQQDE